MSSADSAPIDFAVASRPCEGQEQSGDRAVVVPLADGVLAAVIDGLGHGPAAAQAAETGEAAVRANATTPLQEMLQRCDTALHQTRGVAMTAAVLDHRSERLTWLGVGNVEAILWQRSGPRWTRERVAPSGGIVGLRLPPLRPQSVPLASGAVLVMATDGISGDFGRQSPAGSTREVADAILEAHGVSHDDALVLALRWQGADDAAG